MPPRRAPRLAASSPAHALCLALAVAAARGDGPAPSLASAVVVSAVENVYTRPDETSSVDSQVILGETVEVLEDTAGFARVRTADGNVAWLPERALRRDTTPVERPNERLVEVVSPTAHVYREPSFTRARPLLTAPLGARLGLEEAIEKDGHSWMRVLLPDGRGAFVAGPDVAAVSRAGKPPLKTPADWLLLGQSFFGAPYTWGGVTPAGFDCSGLVQTILKRHGVLLKRNTSEMCFRDPRLVPVAFERVQPGDLLFFGTEDKIDHMGMWAGDGRVLQATAWGVPSTQITAFSESSRLKDRFRYTRRLAVLTGAPKPSGLTPAKAAVLEGRLKELAASGGARYGILMKDLQTGASSAVGAAVSMHAASTMKTPVLLEVLRRVDAGTLHLEDDLPVKNEFKSLVDGSPFTLGLDPETDGPTIAEAARRGGKAPLAFLAKEMIVRSSNYATNLILSLVGPGSVQALCDALGAPTVHVRRCVEDSKAYEKGVNNETDAAGMAAVMEAAVRTPRLSAASRAAAWEILTGQTFNEQIPAGLHPQSGAIVAHKTGSISSVQHDAAVVRLPDGREYVLVILANDFGASEAGRTRVIETTRKMSRAVWEAMIAP
jgi:beta-lactamase class A